MTGGVVRGVGVGGGVDSETDSLGKSFRIYITISFFVRALGGTTPRVPLKLTSSVKFEGFHCELPYKRLKSLICEILLQFLLNPTVIVTQAMLASAEEYTY